MVTASIFLNIIVNSCCTEIDKEYVQLNGFSIELFDRYDRLASPLQNGDTTYTDTVRIETDIQYDFIASAFCSSNSLYAITCPEWGENGLKFKIQNITLSSNETFQGILSNSNFNEFITCNYLHTRSDISLDSLKTILNNWTGGFLDHCAFYINAKPDNPLPRKFKILFKLENNEAIEFETPEIVWI